MATFTQAQHGHPDEVLVTSAALARLLGVSRPAVSQVMHEGSGRLDVFLDSQGRARFHPELSVAQWSERRQARKVSTPTRGQAAAGLDGQAAQAVAHRPLVETSTRVVPVEKPAALKKPTAPTAPRQESKPAAPPTQPPTSPVPPPGVDAERVELAVSRAAKEKFSARLLEVKVRQAEGTLVDRSVVYQKAYTVTKAIQDQLAGIPAQLGPTIVASVEEALSSAGIPMETIRSAVVKSNVQHVVREGLRLGIVQSLRSLTEKPLEELLS